MTDANVVLGHLPPSLLGGEMELDVEAARASVQTIADAMGLGSVEEAAEGILAIVNENMAGALRLVSVQRGHDPREFALVAYGGAGPLHANAVAEIMGSFPVLVPPAPGLLCAIGDLVADFRDEFAQTYIRVLGDADAGEVGDDPRRASASARASGSTARGSPRTPARSRTRPTCATTGRATRSRSRSTRTRRAPRLDGLEERFNALHEQLYGFRMPGTACEIVNLRGDRLRRRAEAGAAGRRGRRRRRVGRGRRGARDRLQGRAAADEDLRPRQARARAPLRRPGDRDRVRLHHRRPPRLRGRGRRQLQHPHQPEGLDDDDDHLREAAGSPRSRPGSRSTRSRSTSSRARSRARATRWTPCSSARR